MLPFTSRLALAATLALGTVVMGSGMARATSLQAAPVLVEMPVGTNASAVTIRNTGATPFDVQIRVFRWVQENGTESFEETDEVAASPPMTTLQPGATYSVRIVRQARAGGPERAYRLLVDQLPDEERQRSGTVALVMRHSIPVFLTPEAASAAQLTFSIERSGNQAFLVAQNSGGRRARLSAASLKTAGGKSISLGSGLLGYVLAGSTMRWRIPGGAAAFAPGQSHSVIATSDQGPVNANARVER
ncbi:MAG: molecular chaperone [Proteobacteria bacterium]|nr:molecular chaperone [Pseudomonadota bacterium]